MIVADTNLVAYFLLRTPRTSDAERVFQRDASWVAPPLWRSELRNVLVQHVRHETLVLHEARTVWSQAARLLTPHEQEPNPERILDLALDRGLSAYDAEYVALAEALGVRVVTDDRKVLAACPALAVSVTEFAAGR